MGALNVLNKASDLNADKLYAGLLALCKNCKGNNKLEDQRSA